jgi:hypothetical protein
MGRYYSGDISGKFWPGIQSSNAPERFGCDPQEPPVVYYCTSDLESCQQELAAIEAKLGRKMKTLQNYFEKQGGSFYNSRAIELMGISPEDLSDYADYELGKKIEATLIQRGICCFEAEV